MNAADIGIARWMIHHHSRRMSTAMKTMVAKTTKHWSRRFRRFIQANEAVSVLEYAVLVGVVVVGIGAALGTFQNQIRAGLTY